MPDPYAVFRDNPRRQATLKTLWPELYEALGGGTPAGPPPERVLPCVIAPCCDRTPRVRAVARTAQYGPSACAAHVQQLADRPGGWPLNVKDARK